ncbi:TonB-dependent receptor [Flammeovirgaceae bacterium 311]|nr:TonB-dependent receptor [Flammeovirgaceae bacterium 311]
MQKLLLALMGFFAFTSAFAQPSPAASIVTGTIQGTVVDAAEQTTLAYATVAVMENGSSQPLKTAFTDLKGSFTLTVVPYKAYTLIITYVGYQTRTIELPLITANPLSLGQIGMSSDVSLLQEVVVVAERLLVEQDIDKLTYHVEIDPESHTLSALEMMRKVPLLSVDGDDNLQLNGSDSYLVLINGKTSSLFVQNPSEIFKSMPASAIKSIEVITNPPARYDAEGVGGIINIITYRKTISGYNGSVSAAISSPRGSTMGGYLTAKAGKFGFSGHLVNNITSSPPAGRSYLREDHTRQTRLVQTGESNNRNSSLNGSGELSYELNALSVFTASYRANSNNGTHDFLQQVALFNGSNNLTQAYQNTSTSRNNSGGNDLGLDLQRSFRKHPEQLLTLSYKVSSNANASSSDFALQPLLNYIEQLSQTQNRSSTREHTLQADYVQPIKKQTLELGVKSSLRRNDSDYFYKNLHQETGAFVLDPSQSNNFDYQQDIHAAYASLSLKKNNWGLRTGARLEETWVDANFRSSGTFATQHYLNLIPSLNLSHKLKNNSTLKLSYNQRLERPGLYHLNPYVNLTDPRNISYGNPGLDPATNHSFNLAYATFIKSSSINAGLFHHFANNSIQRFTSLGEDTVARTTYANIGRRQAYGFSLSGSTMLFNKLSLSLNSTTQYLRITSTFQDRLQHNTGLTLNASGNVSYRFNKTWRANGNLAYNSPQIFLQGRSAGFVSNNLSVHKDILKNNKGSVSLSVRNPFQKYRRYQNEISDPAFYQLQESFSVIRQFSLAFSYRFGKVQTSSPRRKRSIQDDDSKVTE